MAKASSDWSADQYLKFADERTRAVVDLVNRIPLSGGRFLPADTSAATLRIVDLGCGPGNSTAVLASRFPSARLAGVDSSPNMLVTARKTLPGVPFALADLRTYDPLAASEANPDGQPPNLLLANAVFQWLPLSERLPTILRLFATLPPGGVLAYQVPDNQQERTHQAMREVARGVAPGSQDGPWVPILRTVHDRDAIETPEEIYDALAPLSTNVDVWHAVYNHVLPGGARDIVEWMRGTGLQPWVNALPADDAPENGGLRAAFLAAYEARLAELYERRVDGSVIIRYPRLFVVAVKK